VQAELERTSFAHWLDARGLTDVGLRWYLDYCCRDDYGAGLATVSAWAGLHYFASRHGFVAPGDPESERDAVFTWPEGNAWLVQRLAAPLADRLHLGRTVLALRESRHEVQALVRDEAGARLEVWSAGAVVLALPLHVALRLLAQPPAALVQAAATVAHAPWLVANLHLERPLLDRPGAPASWDNVIHHPPGAGTGLGYVDAMHQSLRPQPGPTVLTAYHALPLTERAGLLRADWRPWAERVLADLAPAHPDLRRRVTRVEMARWGHAMAIPRPGLQRHAALTALRGPTGTFGRLRFAHSDLAGYSVFEEAFTLGMEAAAPVGPALR
jgi:predicted NAD/FAD-binding protein